MRKTSDTDFEKYTEDASLLICKGSERRKFLMNVTFKRVLDLDTIQCPPAICLSSIDTHYTCIFNQHTPEQIRMYGYHCSMLNAYKV